MPKQKKRSKKTIPFLPGQDAATMSTHDLFNQASLVVAVMGDGSVHVLKNRTGPRGQRKTSEAIELIERTASELKRENHGVDK